MSGYESQFEANAYKPDPRDAFILAVNTLIVKTETGPAFKGRTQAVKSLRRTLQLAALNR